MLSLLCTILALPVKRTSVVNSPALVVAVQRNTGWLTFDRFVIAISPRMFKMAQRDLDFMKLNHDGGAGGVGLDA